MRDLKQSLTFLEDEKAELQEERESIVKAKAKLELLIKDLEYGEVTEMEYRVSDDDDDDGVLVYDSSYNSLLEQGGIPSSKH